MGIYLLINGVDKTSLLLSSPALTIDWRNYEPGSSAATLYDSTGAYRPVRGQSYEVYYYDLDASPPVSSHKIWGGQIDSFSEQRMDSAADPKEYEIQAVGWAYILSRRILRGNSVGASAGVENGVVYQNKTPREVVSEIISDQIAGEGITLHADSGATGTTDYATTLSTTTFTYVATPDFPLLDGQAVRFSSTTYYVIDGDSSTFKLSLTVGGTAVNFSPTSGAQTVSTIIDIVVFDHVTAGEAIAQMASLAGYVIWVDEDAKVHFVPPNLTAALFDITDTPPCVFRSMTVNRQRDGYQNQHCRRIGFGFAPWGFAQTVGNSSTQSWELGLIDTVRAPYAWNIANVTEVLVNGVAATVGIWRVDTGKDWYWRLGDTRIYQDTAATPLTASDTLRVSYFVIGQDVVFAELADEVTTRAAAEGNTGRYQSGSDNTASTDVLGNINTARGILGVKGTLLDSVNYETDRFGLKVGTKQQITVADFGVNAYYVINSLRATAIDRTFLRYQVECLPLATPKRDDAVDFFKGLSGGGSSGLSSIGGSLGGGSVASSGISGIEVMTPSAGHIAPTIGADFTHEITLGANATLDAPASPTAEAIFCIKLNQDGTGGRTVTFNAFYTGMSGFSLDTTASTYASLTFQINAAGTSAALINIPINGSPIA